MECEWFKVLNIKGRCIDDVDVGRDVDDVDVGRDVDHVVEVVVVDVVGIVVVVVVDVVMVGCVTGTGLHHHPRHHLRVGVGVCIAWF